MKNKTPFFILFLLFIMMSFVACGNQLTDSTDVNHQEGVTKEISREEYIKNPEKFQCDWESEFDVPEWMTNYEEKQAAFKDKDGRMMSVLHMGDAVYYPENSIEGIISAIKMGIDVIEMDLCLTRDNVVVLMHNTTLSQTTDWNKKRGNNGLPLSEKIVDWTYEELCQLNLLMKDGTETTYKIPTFEEALSVCKGRTKVILDKDSLWSWDTDVYPIIQKYEAWDTCIIPRTYSLERQQDISLQIKEDGGVTDVLAFSMFAPKTSYNWLAQVAKLDKSGMNMIAYWGAQSVFEDNVKAVALNLKLIAGDIRILAQTHSSAGGIETEEQFDYLFENGINMVLVDDGLNLQKYIAENFEATE